MESISLFQIKKQTRFFLKQKLQTARLILTDVTPIQLLTEETTNENSSPPESRTMNTISRAAFEVDDYWRIVTILRKRFSRFDRKQWREFYNALILLEYLLMHGPHSFSNEFQSDQHDIKQAQTFHYEDEKGFDWGLCVKRKSERVLMLLEERSLLQEERDRARELTRRTSRSFSSASTDGVVDDQKKISGSTEGINEDSKKVIKDNTNNEQEISKEHTDEKRPAQLELKIEPQKEDGHPFNFLENYSRESLLERQS